VKYVLSLFVIATSLTQILFATSVADANDDAERVYSLETQPTPSRGKMPSGLTVELPKVPGVCVSDVCKCVRFQVRDGSLSTNFIVPARIDARIFGEIYGRNSDITNNTLLGESDDPRSFPRELERAAGAPTALTLERATSTPSLLSARRFLFPREIIYQNLFYLARQTQSFC